MSRNSKNIKPLFVILITFLLVSFSPDRNTDLKPLGAKKIYKHVVRNYVDFDIISLKSNMKLGIKGKSFNLKANIRIKRDSIIWINLSHSTGIPVARLMLTNDSIHVLDRIKKVYYRGDYKSLRDDFKINFSFNTIQGILTNELIAFTNKRKPNKIFEDYRSRIDSNMYVIQNFNDRIIKKQKKKENDFFMLEKILVLPESYKISDFIIEDISGKRNLKVSYSEFKELDGFSSETDSVENKNLFPAKVNFSLKVDSVETSFYLKYSKIKINKETKFIFKVSDSYEIKDL